MPSPATPETAAKRSVTAPSKLVIVVAFGGLMAMLSAGYGVLFTIVDDYKNDYGIGEAQSGLIIGIGFLAGFASQVTIAPLADRGHARRVVLIGLAADAVGLLMMAFGTSLVPILAGRVVSGIGIGMAGPAIRRIVILADPENLGTNVGRLFSADVFGFAIGPAISAALVEPFGIAAPFLVVVAAIAVLTPFVARIPVVETETDMRPQRRLAVDLLRNRAFAGATILGGAYFVMIGGFDALWALVHDELGTSTWIANIGITLFAIPLIVLGPLGGRLAQRVGPFRIAALGIALGAVLMFVYGQLATGAAIFAVAMIHSVTDGLTASASGVAVSVVAPAERQAGAQGMLGAVQAILAGITAPITGAVYEYYGRTAAYRVVAAAMLVLLVLGVWLARSGGWRSGWPFNGSRAGGELGDGSRTGGERSDGRSDGERSDGRSDGESGGARGR